MVKFPLIRTQKLRLMSSMIIPIDNYLSRSWLRQHLYYLGLDNIRLKSYQRLSQFINNGGTIKSIVSNISTFINNEMSHNQTNSQLKHLMYFYNNDLILNDVHNISQCKLFFIFVGYMMLHKSDKLDEFTEKLISIYLESNDMTNINYNALTEHKSVLSLVNNYYDSCDVNHELLFNKTSKKINLFITKDISIEIPPLPPLRNKRLLVKSLIHKELYRALLDPGHKVYSTLTQNGIVPNDDVKQIIRNDLSLFDGLGDYYLSKESSNLLYQFKNSKPYSHETSFGKKSYTLLKTILATNTLLSRLALCYNLHQGLDDHTINILFRDSYVPYLNDWKDLDYESCTKDYKYEQEFIADYFEQYVGALFLEQPFVARDWINEIYQNILFLISDVHILPSRSLIQYDYHSWGLDVIGRKLT